MNKKEIRAIVRGVLNEGQRRKADIHKILKFLKTNKAYAILDASNAPNTTFQFGGCWILADAFSMFYNLPLYVVFNKKSNHVEHFVVRIYDDFLDSDGFQSKHSLIEKVAKDGFYDAGDLEVVEYDEKMNSSDIEQDLEASKKFVSVFENL